MKRVERMDGWIVLAGNFAFGERSGDVVIRVQLIHVCTYMYIYIYVYTRVRLCIYLYTSFFRAKAIGAIGQAARAEYFAISYRIFASGLAAVSRRSFPRSFARSLGRPLRRVAASALSRFRLT